MAQAGAYKVPLKGAQNATEVAALFSSAEVDRAKVAFVGGRWRNMAEERRPLTLRPSRSFRSFHFER